MFKKKRHGWFYIIFGLVLVTSLYLAASHTRLFPSFFRIPAPFPPAAKNSEARWQQDVTYLARELPRLHVNAFHTLSADAFEAQINALQTDIPTLSDGQIAMRIMQLVASLNEGHTRAVPQGELLALDLYPLQLYWFADGPYIINASPDYQDILFSRVTAIGGQSVETLYAAIRPLVASDNEMGAKLRSMLYLLCPELLHMRGLTGAHPALTLLREDGTYFDIVPTPISAAEYMAYFRPADDEIANDTLPLYRQSPGQAYWFMYLEERRTLYFAYNRCTDVDSEPFDTFIDTLWDTVSVQQVDRLVIDLRNNGGGNSALLQPFIKELQTHPLNQAGKLYVIVGRGTFSSAVLNALELQQKTTAIFVGEPTSGRSNHYGEVSSFELPNSHMRVDYATKYFAPGIFGLAPLNAGDLLGALGYSSRYAPPTAYPADSFAPDVQVVSAGADYAAGHDPVMDYILSQALP